MFFDQFRFREPPQTRVLPERNAVTWTPKLKWEDYLKIKADTYKPLSLFEVPSTGPMVNDAPPEELIISPCERWCYCEKLLPAGEELSTYNGSRRGRVVFDGDIVIPALHERCDVDRFWDRNPWMSLTPMEMFSLRTGTRRAKGSVIVAGLGLGHQLIEVSKRKQVTRLVLVEQSEELVDWLYPRIHKHLGRPVDDIVIGDAHAVMPKLSADVALLDIFDSYGNNNVARDRMRWKCKSIADVWAWGSAAV